MYIRFCSPMIVFFAIGSSVSTVAGIVNNILIAFFPAEPLIISTVTVANNIRKIGRIVPRGVGYAASTLFGVLYSERDKAGLKRSLWEALRFGFIVSTIWAVLVYFAIPFLMRLYGTADNPDVKLGATIQLIFMFSFLAGEGTFFTHGLHHSPVRRGTFRRHDCPFQGSREFRKSRRKTSTESR